MAHGEHLLTEVLTRKRRDWLPCLHTGVDLLLFCAEEKPNVEPCLALFSLLHERCRCRGCPPGSVHASLARAGVSVGSWERIWWVWKIPVYITLFKICLYVRKQCSQPVAHLHVAAGAVLGDVHSCRARRRRRRATASPSILPKPRVRYTGEQKSPRNELGMEAPV